MIRSQEDFNNLYEVIWNVYSQWIHAAENDSNWPIQRRNIYSFGPVIGLYQEKYKDLLSFISDDYTDDDILSVVYIEVEKQLKKLQNKLDMDIMEKLWKESYQNELLLLEDREIEQWLNDYFLPIVTTGGVQIELSHIRGLCYIYYGFKVYKDCITSLYNPDVSNLKELYKGIYGKDSELYTYNLVQITPECELMAIDPPRVYDERINKTVYCSNISKELLEQIIKLKDKGLIDKLSLRGSNLITNIYEGRYDGQFLAEAVQYGKVFAIENLGSIPVTKLYSAEIEDCLWIKIDESNITFEELCENEESYENSIVTQVVHLEYRKDHGAIYVKHLDHEFVFYSQTDYDKRTKNAAVKGEAHQRLKSFKIDGAKIPLDIPCERTVIIKGNEKEEDSYQSEEVPFLVFVLKSYFKHTELIDEYFASL